MVWARALCLARGILVRYVHAHAVNVSGSDLAISLALVPIASD